MTDIILCVFALYGIVCALNELVLLLFPRLSGALRLGAEDTAESAKQRICEARTVCRKKGLLPRPALLDCGLDAAVREELEALGYELYIKRNVKEDEKGESGGPARQ